MQKEETKMKKTKPNNQTFEAVYAHSLRDYLKYNKIRSKNIKAYILYSIFCVETL